MIVIVLLLIIDYCKGINFEGRAQVKLESDISPQKSRKTIQLGISFSINKKNKR